MRLRDMLSLINKILPKIALIVFENHTANGTLIYTIKGISNSYIYLSELKQIAVFKEDIDNLLSGYDFLITNQASMNVDQSTYSSVKKEIDNLKNKCILTRELIKQVVREQDVNTISFKLYEFGDFSEYAKFCNELNTKILNPLKQFNIDVSLGELEAGSKWISIIFATSFGVMLFAGIARQAFDILIHDYQQYRVVDTIISDLKLGSEAMKEYREKFDSKRDEETNARVESVISEIEKDPDCPKIDKTQKNELRNSLKQSIELLSVHIDKGLEIYQALELEEKNRYQLPDFTKLLAAKQPQKLLAGANKGDTEKKDNPNNDGEETEKEKEE